MRKQVSSFGMESNWSVTQIFEEDRKSPQCYQHWVYESHVFVKQNIPNELRKSVIRLILVVMTSMYSRFAQS